MRVFYALAILLAAAYVISKPAAPVAAPVYDVSWPQCDLPKPADVQNGIVGVTGGLSLRPNPCLAREAGWFNKEGAYINTGYPGLPKAFKYKNWPKRCDTKDEKCLAYNYGFNGARYAVQYAVINGVYGMRWWLDVETENSWSDSTTINRQALQGGYDALVKYAGKSSVGYYSYPAQWDIITGTWLNGAPAWVATGGTAEAEAAVACQGASFTGGKIVWAQYTNGLDHNVACSQDTSKLYKNSSLDVSF